MVREISYLVFTACLNSAFLLTCILLDFSFLLTNLPPVGIARANLYGRNIIVLGFE